MPTSASVTGTSADSAFLSRTDLTAYSSNARLLFALQLQFQLEDIQTVATNSLTDSANDCKCDLIYVDQDAGAAIIAQGYEAKDSKRKAAPANKAADLNTAAAWLLGRPLKDLPEHLRPAARELRNALKLKTIKSLQFWFVHNLPESKNVRNELHTVELTADGLIQQHFSKCGVENISAVEVGQETLEEWYQALKTPILVNETFKIPCAGGYPIQGKNWDAYATAIPARWLYDIFQSHKDKLFSANLRGYLGSIRSVSNINNGIKSTADKQPDQFWVFNNGITALVHDFKKTTTGLEITGLSIVNGAQTTGAIGSLKSHPKSSAMVQARFVKCQDVTTVENIIRCNNSQNLVEAADFRSNDAVQKRLRSEFKEIPDTDYQGCRRGGHQDVIRRPGNSIPYDTAAQALAAFHNNPVVAYNRKSQIWLSDDLYASYFHEETHAAHIVFAYSLLRCIQERKLSLMRQLNSGEELQESRKNELMFLRKRGATFLLASAIASCLEIFLEKPVANKFRASFGDHTSPKTAQKHWDPIVTAVLPLYLKLMPVLDTGLNNAEEASRGIVEFKSMVDFGRSMLAPSFKKFADKVTIS